MSFINDFLSLIYPRCCEACDRLLYAHERLMCNHCRLNLPKSNYHLSTDTELDKVFYGRVPLVYAWPFYLFEKSGRIQKLLHAIKYQGQKELAYFIGTLYGEDLKRTALVASIDLVIPVPLHPKKLRSRGYNQSEWFAKGLSERLKKPLVTDQVERLTDTETQTRKTKYQRWENVEGVFSCHNTQALENKHVLLVDDVITTGATIEAVHHALKDIEGIRLSVASIAFAAKLH